jgi:hypothetical protein
MIIELGNVTDVTQDTGTPGAPDAIHYQFGA